MNSNKKVVPEAKAALDKFKMEVANEVGVNLKEGYNGDITAKQAGSIGGMMVNLMTPQQQWKFQRTNRNVNGHMMDINFTMVVGL
ncbi:MAG: alpha/beta-type small acid-soluble spore protein [Ruminococcaceae bacterium]|nr:alpha/beta-type small acid-soluble spore protein [Oscillospiraceae bacterium]